jgi:hypothetical protein
VLEVDEPQFNHNGGTLLFGPSDGYLYISLGDGGGADDVELGHVEDWYAANAGGNGQDIQQNLLGDILRIDVDSGVPYGIPADNPFRATPGCADGCDETWAYGFRNPYRMYFDLGGNRDLFVGDAGQELWEEVSIAVKGGTFGWNVKEGTHCFSTENPDESPAECPDTVGAGHPRAGEPLIDPVIEVCKPPSAGRPGGSCGRRPRLPRPRLAPVLRALCLRRLEPGVRGARRVAVRRHARKRGLWMTQELWIVTSPTGRLEHYLLGFGQDPAGEIYVLTTDETGPTGTTGKVFKLVRPSG